MIRIDHKSLLFLSEHKASTKLQQKAVLKLMDLSFTIAYEKGITNSAADALSGVLLGLMFVLFLNQYLSGWTNWLLAILMILLLLSFYKN